MRVLELAKDLKIDTEALLQLLREMGVAVKGASAQVSEADAARVIARMERSRRSGAKDAAEAVHAAVEDAAAGAGARRRRRRVATPDAPEAAEAPPEPEPTPEPVPEPEPPRPIFAETAEERAPEVEPTPAPARARGEPEVAPELPE